MAKRTPVKISTKKHLARLERERRQAAAIKYGAIAVILAVILIIGYGILYLTVIIKYQPVAKVGDDVITTREFQARVRWERQRLIGQYVQMLLFAQAFGMDPYTDPTFSQQLGIIEYQLNNTAVLGDQVLNQMIDGLIIRQEAARRGITISEEEIEQDVRVAFDYYPSGTPTATITITPVAYSTLSPTQIALVTLTPTATPFQTFTPSPTATPDLTATPTLALTVSPTTTPTLIPTAFPTATPYTLQGFQDAYKSAVEGFADLGFTKAEYRRLFENRLYYEKVFELVTANVPRYREQVWARHILVENEAVALLVRSHLQNGKDWTVLAANHSSDPGNKDKGGDLGWFARGTMLPAFEDVAFNLEIGEISQPVQTLYGWHIIQVLGHEMRPLEESEYQQAREARFSEWLEEMRTQTEITIHDYWIERVPTEPSLEEALAQLFGP